MHKTILASLFLLAACSNSSEPLNAAFAGTWTGTVSYAGSLTGIGYQGRMVTTVDGNSLLATDICLGSEKGGGTLILTGSENSASWSGSYQCPATVITGCFSFVVTYTRATATLSGTTLAVIASGTSNACGTSGDITITFIGAQG